MDLVAAVVTVVMRILGRPDGQPSPIDDQYLERYDPNGHNGRGDIRTTRDARAAMRFTSSADALECWRTQADPPHHRRADGQPNRPLSAYSVTMEPAPA